MHLNTRDITRCEISICEGILYSIVLGGAVRSRKRAGSSVLIHGGACNNCAAYAARMFQHDDFATLRSHVTICICIKSFTPSVRCQHASALEHGSGVWKKGEVDATND